MYRYIIALVLASLFVYENIDAQVSTIVNMNADASAPLPPTGVCNGTLLLNDGGTITSTTVADFDQSLGVAPLELGFVGQGYALAGQNAGQNLRLVLYDLDTGTPTELSSNLISTGNATYLFSNVVGVYYNTINVNTTGGFTTALVYRAAPCNISQCLVLTSWNGAVKASEVVHTSIVTNGVTLLRQDQTTGNVFVDYVTAGGSFTQKFTSAFVASTASAAQTNAASGMTTDGTSVYVTRIIGGVGNLQIFNQNTMAVTAGGVPGGGTSTEILAVDGFLYMYISNTTPRVIRKVRISDLSVQATLNLTNTDAMLNGGMMYDAANDKLYTVSNDSGSVVWRRINPNTLVQEDTIGRVFAGQSGSSSPDFYHQRLWQVSQSGGFLTLTKITLCS